MSSTSDFIFSLRNSTSPCSNKFTALSNRPFKVNRKSSDEESYSNLNIQSKEVIQENDISNNMIDSLNTNMEIQSDSSSAIYLVINSFSLF